LPKVNAQAQSPGVTVLPVGRCLGFRGGLIQCAGVVTLDKFSPRPGDQEPHCAGKDRIS